MKLFIKLILIFLLLGGFEVKSQDFEVAPVKMYFKVDGGSKQMKKLTIKNHSSIKQQYVIVTEDFIIDKYGNKKTLPKNSTKSSCAEWLTFSQFFFDINPNESIEVDVTMSPPSGDMSSRWAYMYVQTATERTAFDADKESTRTGINLSARIAIQVFRSTKVKQEPKGIIEQLREDTEDTDGGRVFTALIKNTGSTIFNSKVTILAANLTTGEETEITKIETEVYPGFSREIKFKLAKTLPKGEYSLVAILDYGSKTSLEGTRLNKKLIILE